MGRRANLQKSERLPVRDAKASLTGKRPYYALASLPEGGVSDPLTGTPLRGESGPTTRRFSLRKTSIWGPPHGPVRGAALPPLGGVGSLPLWGESVLAYAASLTGCLDDP